jgi:hypothetical protein
MSFNCCAFLSAHGSALIVGQACMSMLTRPGRYLNNWLVAVLEHFGDAVVDGDDRSVSGISDIGRIRDSLWASSMISCVIKIAPS